MNSKLDRLLLALCVALALLALVAILKAAWGDRFNLEDDDDQTITVPGYPVGEFREPRTRIYTRLDGQEQVLLEHFFVPGKALEVPVKELRLVNPRAKQSKRGTCAGVFARNVARRMPRNSRFLPRAPRIACSAFTSYILKSCGLKGMSYAVNGQYAQLRRRGAKIVASRMSTRYTPYFRYLKSGDLLFFHKRGGRMGHEEIYVGNGLTAGTSSSMLRVGIRRVGNRGFSTMTVLRI